jgi:hypothetical protein
MKYTIHLFSYHRKHNFLSTDIWFHSYQLQFSYGISLHTSEVSRNAGWVIRALLSQ